MRKGVSKKSIGDSQWMTRPAVVLVVMGCLVLLVGCTKKIVSHRGIYSSEQLPKETDTPVFDAIGDGLEGLSGENDR